MSTETPYPCMATLQKILCNEWRCYSRTEESRIPGGTCWPDGGIYSTCDNGEGHHCPAPDCVYYGQCVCLCHTA